MPLKCPQGANITVVYNAFVWPENNWRMIIASQLSDLVKSGLLNCAHIHVALSVPSSHPGFTYSGLENLLAEGAALIHSAPGGGQMRVVPHLDNFFEYPGLDTLWHLAQDDDDEVAASHRIFLYFHAKGMVHHGFLQKRLDHVLFDRTILPWRRIVQRFVDDDSVRLIAQWPSSAGWAWVNFWWARGSYIRSVQKPVLQGHKRRHYYESWLGYGNKTNTRAFSLCTCDFTLWRPRDLKNAKCVGDPQTDPKCAA